MASGVFLGCVQERYRHYEELEECEAEFEEAVHCFDGRAGGGCGDGNGGRVL